MPTYQYACTACDHAFEQFQAFTEDALTECPRCGGRLRKLFNAVGVVFKGSGFYRTDSRAASSSAEGGSSAGGSTATKTESRSESKSESKPGSKSESGSGSATSSSSASSSSSSD